MAKTYTTKSGDQWDSIAYSQLGSVDYTGELLQLNLQYRDCFLFPSGIALTLPEVEDKADTALPPWKTAE